MAARLAPEIGRVAVADRELDAAQQATADHTRLLAARVRTKSRRSGDRRSNARRHTGARGAATIRLRSLVAARVEQGATPPLDRDMLRVDVQRLESERLVEAGDVERRLVELKRLLGSARMPPFLVSPSNNS